MTQRVSSSRPNRTLLSGAARILLVLSGIAAGGPASAADAVCLGFDDLGPGAALGLATVGSAMPRVNFVKNADAAPGCPSDAAACRDRAYLVAGDQVIVSGTAGAFSCASYVDAKGLVRAGWLPTRALQASAAAVTGLSDWTGRWRGGPEQTIVIRTGKAGELVVSGEASFGALDPARVRRGAVNLGTLEGSAKPAGSLLAFTMGDGRTLPYDTGEESDCRARLRLLPPFLLVEDNGSCGGMNVSFSGAYRRSP